MRFTREFEEDLRKLSCEAWRATSSTRRKIFHSLERCPQRQDPYLLARVERDGTCADCHDFHLFLMLEIHYRWNLALSKLTSTGESSKPGERAAATSEICRQLGNTKLCSSWVLSARQRAASERGEYVELRQLFGAKWFCSALPDGDDQALANQVLNIVRCGDIVYGHDLPYERLMDERMATPAMCAVEVERVIEALRAVAPAWVKKNFDDPMANRLAAGRVVGVELDNAEASIEERDAPLPTHLTHDGAVRRAA